MIGWAGSVAETSDGKTDISATRLKIARITTPARLPRRNVFVKIVSLSQHSDQDGIILPCMYFYFRSLRMTFVSLLSLSQAPPH